MADLTALDLGYTFKSEDLLKTALTHSSAGEPHNERLEFLGDAVLELISTEYLYTSFKDLSEGVMTSTRASAVCEPSLCTFAETLKLGDFLILGKGEESSGGRTKPSILADAVEAVLGAIYLDGGYEEAKKFMLRFLPDALRRPVEKRVFKDYKSALQELVQADKAPQRLSYRLVSTKGPDHNKQFHSQVLLGNKVVGDGQGSSRKTSEQEAARVALENLDK